MIKVYILPYEDRHFWVGKSLLTEECVKVLLSLVQNLLDIFAWSSYQVPRVDPKFIVHKLNVDPLYPQEAKVEAVD